MGRSRTARVSRGRGARRGSEAFSLLSRSRQLSCLELLAREQEEQAEKQPFDLVRHLLILALLPCKTAGAASEEPVPAGLLHSFLPAVIADPGA